MSNTLTIIEGTAVSCMVSDGHAMALIAIENIGNILSVDITNIKINMDLNKTYRIIGHLEGEMVPLEHGQMLVNRIIADHVEAIN